MTQKTQRLTKTDLIEFYLPITLARLQVETARDILGWADPRGLEYPGVKHALGIITLATRSRLAARFEDRIQPFYGPFPLKPYQSLSAEQHTTLRSEAEKLKTDNKKKNFAIYQRKAFRKSDFKWTGVKDSFLGQAIKAAIDTIACTDESMLDLRFVVDPGIIDRSRYGGPKWDEDYGLDGHFHAISKYVYGIQYRAWTALLMFCGLAGGDLNKAALKAAAVEFMGIGEKSDDFIKTGIMQLLNVGHRLSSGHYTDDETKFRGEVEAALNKIS